VKVSIAKKKEKNLKTGDNLFCTLEKTCLSIGIFYKIYEIGDANLN
jgi:hypothetical protein